jgi:hypothetical protein
MPMALLESRSQYLERATIAAEIAAKARTCWPALVGARISKTEALSIHRSIHCAFHISFAPHVSTKSADKFARASFVSRVTSWL